MGPIQVVANASLDILSKIRSGELEIHGIVIRDSIDKKFRHILLGAENLPGSIDRLAGDPPSLKPLLSVLNVTQILQIASIAQGAVVMASLQRIEGRLDGITAQLHGINARLEHIMALQQLIVEVSKTRPHDKLCAAKNAARQAIRHDNKGALIAAAMSAEESALNFWSFARGMVRVEENGVPIALLAPTEYAELVEACTDASVVASALQLALNDPGAASKLMRNAETALRAMRERLANSIGDPELLIRRSAADRGNDGEILAAAKRLQIATYQAAGRTVLIEQGLLTGDPSSNNFEQLQFSAELSFFPIKDVTADAAGRP